MRACKRVCVLFFSSSACELQTSDAGVCLPGDGGAYCTVEVVLDGFYYLSRAPLSSLSSLSFFFFLLHPAWLQERELYLFCRGTGFSCPWK